MKRGPRRTLRLAAAAGLALALAASAAGQGFRGQRRGRFNAMPPKMATPESFDGAFNFCRLAFQMNGYGDGGNWGVDYPRADVNLSIRLSELTKTPISRDESGEPNHFVIRPTDPELFHCPFVMATEVGSIYFDPVDVANLRAYLLKGGFLWADDFWGSYAWDVWAQEIAKVLPPGEYPTIDLPLTHPLFRTMFEVKKVAQIPSINAWMGMGGGTSERGYDSAEPHARAIVDRNGRILVLVTHNTDYGDSWEREADDPTYFYRFSVDGYALGINVVLYSMTH